MPSQTLSDIAEYHADTESSLRLFYSALSPQFYGRFVGYLQSEVADELAERLSETDMRSVLVLMARVEAAFREDYRERARNKGADPISIAFRKMHKKRGENVRLDRDIWETWRKNISDPNARALISALRGALKYRHWLAHGRYWQVGNKYDFQALYPVADAVLSGFPLLT